MDEYNFVIKLGEHITLHAQVDIPTGETPDTSEIAFEVWKLWGQSAGYNRRRRPHNKTKVVEKTGRDWCLDRLFQLGED